MKTTILAMVTAAAALTVAPLLAGTAQADPTRLAQVDINIGGSRPGSSSSTAAARRRDRAPPPSGRGDHAPSLVIGKDVGLLVPALRRSGLKVARTGRAMVPDRGHFLGR